MALPFGHSRYTLGAITLTDCACLHGMRHQDLLDSRLVEIKKAGPSPATSSAQECLVHGRSGRSRDLRYIVRFRLAPCVDDLHRGEPALLQSRPSFRKLDHCHPSPLHGPVCRHASSLVNEEHLREGYWRKAAKLTKARFNVRARTEIMQDD